MSAEGSERPRWVRIGAAVALLVGLGVFAWASGITDAIDVARVRALVASAGPWGVLVFLAAFCVANLLQVPTMILVVAAIVGYGTVAGGLLGWFGATLACTTTFLTFRAVGGTGLGAIRHPWARYLLGHLDRRPVLVLALLRTFLQASTPLNAALALTRFPLGAYLLGSALGLVVPVGVAMWLTDLLLPVGAP